VDIRVESVLSKYPIHNLAKKGNASIQIVHKNGSEIDLVWKVSPSRDYGEPRQLAYKLDRLIINRHVQDAQGSPFIRLGSLDQICKELDFCDAGKNYKNLKRAFYQNAFVAITAKLKYTGTDGSEQSFEAGFTRYSVVFTGERLSNGKEADAVFIELTPLYQKVLNTARARPLDYDYLKKLPPAAGRFYELISYSIFAALRHPNTCPEPKLSYSDYCIRSPQHRYYELWKVKRQMTRVHRPHLQSRYLQDVRYEETQDPEGNPDWIMFYRLGPKAKEEFNRKKSIATRSGATTELPAGDHRILDQVELEASTARITQSSAVVPIAAAIEAPQDESTQKSLPLTWNPLELVQYFHKIFRGIENYQPYSRKEVSLAENFLVTYGSDQAQFIVDFGMQEARKTKYEMQNFAALQQYIPEARKAYNQRHREHELMAEIEAREEQQRRENQDEHQLVLQPLKDLPKIEYRELYQRSKTEILEKIPDLKYQPMNETFERMILYRMLERLEKKSNEEEPRSRPPARPGHE